MKTILKSEFAKKKGVSAGRVSQWLKSRIITCEPDGRIDPQKADAELARNLDQARRIDWECSFGEKKSFHRDEYLPGDGPPPPFTGNIIRDFGIMTLQSFYDFFIQKIGPVQLRVLQEAFHVSKDSARKTVIMLCFKCHEIFKDYIEKDVFPRSLLRIGEDTDDLSAHLLKRRPQKTHPPRDFNMLHPDFLLKLLEEEKQSDDPLFASEEQEEATPRARRQGGDSVKEEIGR